MTVEEIERAVSALSPQELARFYSWLDEFELAQFVKDGFYHATPDELAGVDRGLRASAEGRFATPAEVAETFAKFRIP